jgi:Rieske Fe-S protein
MSPSDPERRKVDLKSTLEEEVQRREVVRWLWRVPVLLAAGVGSWGMYEAIHTHFFKRRPDPTPSFVAHTPVTVAPLSHFEADWAEQVFAFATQPSIAMRLPGPIPGSLNVGGVHIAAFSRICTHLGCAVQLNRDTEAIAFAFNHRTDGPQLVCRCHLSVFDPQQAGRAVAGPAVYPLRRVELAVTPDGVVQAVGLEDARGGYGAR